MISARREHKRLRGFRESTAPGIGRRKEVRALRDRASRSPRAGSDCTARARPTRGGFSCALDRRRRRKDGRCGALQAPAKAIMVAFCARLLVCTPSSSKPTRAKRARVQSPNTHPRFAPARTRSRAKPIPIPRRSQRRTLSAPISPCEWACAASRDIKNCSPPLNLPMGVFAGRDGEGSRALPARRRDPQSRREPPRQPRTTREG